MRNRDKIINEVSDKIIKWHLKPQNNQYGLLVGKTGECLFFYNMYEYTGDRKYLKYIENFISEVIDHPDKIVNTYTFCDGTSGFIWFLAFLEKKGLIDSIYDVTDTNVTDFLYETAVKQFDVKNWDFMHGALGIVLALANHESRFINLMEDQLIRLKEKDNDLIYWYSEFSKDKVNLGLAHGIPSIIYFLSRYQTQLKKIDLTFIEHIIRTLTRFKLDKGAKSLYPSFEGDSSYSRLAWCYGDISIGCSLLNISSDIENANNMILEIANHSKYRKDITDNFIADSCVCHGSAGVELIFEKFYKKYSDPSFKLFSNYMAEKTESNLMERDFKFF